MGKGPGENCSVLAQTRRVCFATEMDMMLVCTFKCRKTIASKLDFKNNWKGSIVRTQVPSSLVNKKLKKRNNIPDNKSLNLRPFLPPSKDLIIKRYLTSFRNPLVSCGRITQRRQGVLVLNQSVVILVFSNKQF